jgi:hypothetical protein
MAQTINPGWLQRASVSSFLEVNFNEKRAPGVRTIYLAADRLEKDSTNATISFMRKLSMR